eukprot:3350083-Rhodomonas_salina.2
MSSMSFSSITELTAAAAACSTATPRVSSHSNPTQRSHSVVPPTRFCSCSARYASRSPVPGCFNPTPAAAIVPADCGGGGGGRRPLLPLGGGCMPRGCRDKRRSSASSSSPSEMSSSKAASRVWSSSTR